MYPPVSGGSLFAVSFCSAHHLTSLRMSLGTDENNAVIVLGASNRPWDIDEAIQRRLSRSFKVGLPSFNQRVQILSVILCSDPSADVSTDDINELAKRTEKCVNGHAGPFSS
jgi:SpoVK/Ycf46/Vps4 family AAA+-type ATPase